MIKKYVYLMFLISLGLAANLIAQPVLDIQITDPNPEVIYISDLDILQLASADEFFRIGIQLSDQEYENCVLTLTFSKDDQLLARIISKPFRIPAITHPGAFNGYVSNVDLMTDKFYLVDNPADPNYSEYRVDVQDSKLSTNQIDNIERDLLSSGKLPVGHYVLDGTLRGNNVDSQDMDDFDITNPSFVELVSPGGEAGSGFVEDIYNEFPVFQWNGNGTEYQGVVFEKKYALQSLDNIMNMNPNWKSDLIQGYSAIYPQVGEVNDIVIPLEYGKTYYWMVRMFVNTSAGQETINSEIWQFKLVDPASLGDEQGSIARNTLIEFLRDYIGDKADELAKQLGDYDVKTINVNGRDISLEDLYQLINEYRLKDVEVVDLILPAGSY